MNGPLFSPSWYRVASLAPRIRSHARFHRQQYRGQIWYVLQDLSTERFYRFSPAGYFIIGIMDGRRTVQEIWEEGTAHLGDEAPTQEEMIRLLSQLHAADVLLSDVPPDTVEMLERHESLQRRRWQNQLLSVMAWRIPLFDPERILRKFLPLVRPFVGWFGLLLWMAVVVPAVILAVIHWTDLTNNIVDRVLAPQNLALIWLLFPIMKGLHEFGHAFVTKAYGGEVHDMGVMILVLTPVPYVDASAAWAFREKSRRVFVGAAGILVELFLAALAFYVWLNAEPGPARAVAYNAMLIAGVSTVLFNGNPLLRFDGYYILADLLEIPNLRARASSFIGYLGERYVFGRRETEPPHATAAERAWFVTYALASLVYRVFIVIGIILFIAGKFFLVGVILAILAAAVWTLVPTAKALTYLFTSPRIRSVRVRAVAISTLIVALLAALIILVPVPLRSMAEGVVWIPDDAMIRAGGDGFIDRVVATPGARVRPRQVLLVMHDPMLAAEVRVLRARLRELEARYEEQRARDLVQAAMVREEIRYVTEGLAKARERSAALVVHSKAEGVFVLPRAEDLPGRFVRKGELIAYVVELDTITVRAVVSQADIDLVRRRTHRVDIRLAERLAETLPAKVTRFVPGGVEQLPSTVLGSEGGGRIAIDPTDPRGMTALQKMFQVDLEVRTGARILNVAAGCGCQGSGGRVYVRFDHGTEPLMTQWYWKVRRLFLSRFDV